MPHFTINFAFRADINGAYILLIGQEGETAVPLLLPPPLSSLYADVWVF